MPIGTTLVLPLANFSCGGSDGGRVAGIQPGGGGEEGRAPLRGIGIRVIISIKNNHFWIMSLLDTLKLLDHLTLIKVY